MNDHAIEAGGTVYPIRFGQSALYLLEQELMQMEGRSIAAGNPPKTQKVSISQGKNKPPLVTERHINGLDLLKAIPDGTAVHLMFWAGIESARIKLRTRTEPYTLHEAGDIIDEAGGVEAVTLPVMRAYSTAFPKKLPPEYLALLEENAEKESPKNAQEETAESTGKTVSSKRQKRA